VHGRDESMLRSFGRTSNITLVSECSDGCPLPQWAQSHNVDEAGRRPSSALLRSVQTGERHGISAVAFVVAEGGFEPPTFGLCDLTHLSMRVGLYLHRRGVLAIQSLRLPRFRGLVGIARSLLRRRFHGRLKSDLPVHRCAGRPFAQAPNRRPFDKLLIKDSRELKGILRSARL
jgi:hypothetical protein